MIIQKYSPHFTESKKSNSVKGMMIKPTLKKPFDKKEFGRRLKYARERLMLSQEDLADLVGINKITISYYETGNRKDMNPSITTVYQLACVLDVSIDWLCGISHIPDISRMSSDIYREFYICTLMDLMDRADGYKKYKKNNKYFKLPRRGLPYKIRESLDILQIAYSEDRIDSEAYEREKNKIWETCNDYSVEEILETIFNDKKYIEYCKIIKVEQKASENSEDKADLPF